MTLSIKWTRPAAKEKSDILRYWTIHNKSETYSIRLEAEVKKTINRILENPFIGTKVKNTLTLDV